MSLWLDNTGLHAFGRALAGRAANETDVRDFLHVVTLLPFTNTLCVNAFESESVRRRSTAVCEQFETRFSGSKVFSLTRPTRADYLAACRQAGTICLQEIAATYVSRDDEKIGNPEGTLRVLDGGLDLVGQAEQGLSRTKLLQLERDCGVHVANIAPHYMMLFCEGLRTEVLRIAGGMSKQSDTFTAAMDSYLRLFLNDILARMHGAVYCPSITRAKRIARQRRVVAELVMAEIDKVAARFRDVGTSLPAVVSVLLVRGRGEPNGVISAALELRERTGPLRRWIEELSQRLETDEPEQFFEAQKSVRELGLQLLSSVNQESALLDLGMEIAAWAVKGKVSTPSARLIQRVKGSVWTPRIVAISELVRHAAWPGGAEGWYKKLMAQTMAP